MQRAYANWRRSEQARAPHEPGTMHVPAADRSLSYSSIPFSLQTHGLSGVMSQRSTAANVTTTSLLGSDFRAVNDRSSIALYCYLFPLQRLRALTVALHTLQVSAAMICLLCGKSNKTTLRSVCWMGATELLRFRNRPDHTNTPFC